MKTPSPKTNSLTSRHKLRYANRGLSIVEVLVASTILSGIMLLVTQVMITSQTAMQVASFESRLQTKTQAIVNEIANDVKSTSSDDVTKYGITDGVVWFYRCLGNYVVGETPPGEPTATTSGLYWSTKKIEYKFETEGGKNLLSKYENGTRVKICSENVSASGFSMAFNGTSRVRIFLRLERSYFDTASGELRKVEATAGTDIKRQN